MELIPKTAQDVKILALANPKDTLTEIIGRMPHNTIFVVAALFAGRKSGDLEFDFEKDTIKVLDNTIYRDRFDDSIVALAETIRAVVEGYAEDEIDVTINHIQQWAGLNPDTWTIVKRYITEFDEGLTTYSFTHDKVKHEFITLTDNASKQWGKKLK